MVLLKSSLHYRSILRLASECNSSLILWIPFSIVDKTRQSASSVVNLAL